MSVETLINAAVCCDAHLWRSQAQMMSWWFKNGNHSRRTLPPLIARHLERPPTRGQWRDISSEIRKARRRVSGRFPQAVRAEIEDALEARRIARAQHRRDYMRNLMRKRRSQVVND
jgi:hypothetical protein